MRQFLADSPAPVPIDGADGSGHNLSRNDRWHVHVAYNPSANRPQPVPANPRPDYVVSRNYAPLVLDAADRLAEPVTS